MDKSLTGTLATLAATEANLTKLDRLWSEIQTLLPKGVDFSDNPLYEERRVAFNAILEALPSIAGWKPKSGLFETLQIAQMKLGSESGETEAYIAVANELEEPGKRLREYRVRFNRRRAELLRPALDARLVLVEGALSRLSSLIPDSVEATYRFDVSDWGQLKKCIAEIDVLLGSIKRPSRWRDLRRHLESGTIHDLRDIISIDWPAVRTALRPTRWEDLRRRLGLDMVLDLRNIIYIDWPAGRPSLAQVFHSENKPLEVGVADLDILATPQPTSRIRTALPWNALDQATFERLIFRLIGTEEGYEKPVWLPKPNTPEHGAEISVDRVSFDSHTGITRRRAIIQCTHRPNRDISIPDIASLKERMKICESPLVEVVVLATSGRFAPNEVEWVEKRKQSDSVLRIELWPKIYLEMLLAARPAIVAEFFPRARMAP